MAAEIDQRELTPADAGNHETIPTVLNLPNRKDGPAPIIEMRGCPMNNTNLPPVGEMEHFVARCYCFLCTCGKHVCPAAARKRTEIMKSMYATNYRAEFYRKHNIPTHPLRLETYSNNSLPMDLQTIKQRDFQPYTIQPEPSFKPRATTQSLQFVSRSSYQANYPNWGPNEVIRVRPFWLPYRGDQVKMEPKTTYNQDFKLPSKSSDTFEQFVKTANTTRSTAGPMAAGSEFYGQTTTMRNNQNKKKVQRPVLEGRQEGYFAVESPKGHFNTTYRADFFPKQPVLRPMKRNATQALF